MNPKPKQIFKRFAFRGVMVCSLLSLGAMVLPAQNWRYEHPRRADTPVDRTIHDLQRLAQRTGPYNSGRERGRFDNAIRHLSEFDSRYDRGHFDKDKLDDAIGDVQHLVDRNPLDERARGILWNDLSSLRAFRANRGYGNGNGFYNGRRY
ncbi:MAG TPA: hypothetical protein VN737_00545 [Bryobacteraceae bacterium]|nr:hypothetical protein [Bryobacteraceae bacterium]